MTLKIDTITLGVHDLDQARAFYERGLGGTIQVEDQVPVVNLGPQASPLALRPWEAVAHDAGVDARSSGFRAFTLSYIVESADDVNHVLNRAERHGGTISKTPKSAFWGYSAYVTDPSGYLWKIASTKRRPLFGKESAANNARVIKPQEVPVTIGVADMKRSKDFYENGLGLPVKKSFGNKFVMFEGVDGTSDLGMYKREALADDAAVEPEGSGFHGFSISHVAASAQSAEALLAQAARAGGQVGKAPRSGQGGCSGCFSDLDGNIWRVGTRD
jgi:catechol 2,3-dioxygenase-like lactoylglutathione lyase family enzyme